MEMESAQHGMMDGLTKSLTVGDELDIGSTNHCRQTHLSHLCSLGCNFEETGIGPYLTLIEEMSSVAVVHPLTCKYLTEKYRESEKCANHARTYKQQASIPITPRP